jgi:DMSO reductase anchor subunit
MEPAPIITAFALAGIAYFVVGILTMRKDTEGRKEAFWQCSRAITAVLGVVLILGAFYYAVHWIMAHFR